MTRWEWIKTVKRIVGRDKTCQLKLPGCTGTAQTADHVISRANGGSNKDDNLRGSCHSCNRSKGNGSHRRRGTGSNSRLAGAVPQLAGMNSPQQSGTAEPVAPNHKPALIPWIG